MSVCTLRVRNDQRGFADSLQDDQAGSSTRRPHVAQTAFCVADHSEAKTAHSGPPPPTPPANATKATDQWELPLIAAFIVRSAAANAHRVFPTGQAIKLLL